MNAKLMKQMLMALMLGLVLVSCGPSYVGVNAGYGPHYRYHDPRPYRYYRPGYFRPGYYRPGPPVIVAPPPRVYYRRPPHYYRPVPPAYGRRYGNPGFYRGQKRGWR